MGVPMSTRIARIRNFVLAGAMLGSVSLCDIARACDWPEVHDFEERGRIPHFVAGFPFVWEFYSYHLPTYHIASLQCSKRIEWGPRGWSWSLGKETTPLNQITGSAQAANAKPSRPLPPLPALPALRALPPVPQSPASKPLPPLPNLPPLPPL